MVFHSLTRLARRSAGFARSGHGFRSGFNGLNNVVVARAATQVAFELLANGLLVQLSCVASDHVRRRHDHPRRTKTALQAMVFAEGFLNGVQGVGTGGQALDGRDIRTFGHNRQHGTRLHRLTIDMNGTGATLRSFAAHMGSRQAQMLANEGDQ